MKTCALWFSPDLEIQGYDAGDGASERDGSFTGQRFAEYLDGAGSGAAINNVDLRERNVGQFLVIPKERRGRSEQTNIQTIVAALAIQQGNELVQAVGAAAGSGKSETARSTIQQIGVADQDAQHGASGSLFRNPHSSFFHAGRAAIRTKEDTHAKSLTGSGFAFFEPRAFDGE